MREIVKRIAKLINVKSIVTLILTSVFAFLAIRGQIESNQFLTIFTVIISFYFGTQMDKKSIHNDIDSTEEIK